MTETKHTKKALAASLLSMLLCVVMLVGSTFAWFTDTASTDVSRIQSGNLDIELQMQDENGEWVTAEGKTIGWQTLDNRAQSKILWEPGATYKLQALKLVNNSNLAIQYKVVITGIDGDAKLNKVIDWEIQLDNQTLPLDAENTWLPSDAKEKIFTISGTMQTTAGNEYQDLSIDGIAITVYATQSAYEKDSETDQYDANAWAAQTFETPGTYTLNTTLTGLSPNDVAVKANGKGVVVNITGGIYDGGQGGNNQAVQANNGAEINITGGTFTVGADANGEGNSVVYAANGSTINISGGEFYTDTKYDKKYYVLNLKNNSNSKIVVTGGSFRDFNPADGDDKDGGTFVADGYTVINEKRADGHRWYTVVRSIGDSNDLKEAIKAGGNMILADDVTVPFSKPVTFAGLQPEMTLWADDDKDTYLDLDGHTLSMSVAKAPKGTPCFFNVRYKMLTVDNGTIDCELGDTSCYGINVNGDDAKVVINGGNYYGAPTAIQVEKGQLIINDGFFDLADTCKQKEPQQAQYIVNCIDANYRKGIATISIVGGTFVNFDPSNNPEGPGTSYVAEGYKVVSEEQDNGDIWYTVVAE